MKTDLLFIQPSVFEIETMPMLDWFLDPDPYQPDEGVRSDGGQPLPRGRSPLQDQHRQGVPVPEGGPHSREQGADTVFSSDTVWLLLISIPLVTISAGNRLAWIHNKIKLSASGRKRC